MVFLDDILIAVVFMCIGTLISQFVQNRARAASLRDSRARWNQDPDVLDSVHIEVLDLNSSKLVYEITYSYKNGAMRTIENATYRELRTALTSAGLK